MNTMSKSKHTPGPWVVEVVDGRMRVATAKRRFEGSTEGLQVAVVCNARWADEEHTADARLIAAAPDLLAALRAMVAYADECGRDCGGDGETVSAARVAIAKAEGDE